MSVATFTFALVYLGMILGGLPYLQLDRTGVALLGAIALVASGTVTLEEAGRAIHAPTLMLLFSFMVISAQLRLGGFYAWVTRRLAGLPYRPPVLLAALISVVAALSAVFSNDIVCLAMTPVLVHGCLRRRLDPVPFLLALACAANIGSALTLIGNPQNMLIGESLGLSFAGYAVRAALPVFLGLVATWMLVVWQTRGRWEQTGEEMKGEEGESRAHLEAHLDRWQSAKGLAVATALVAVFLWSSWPRELAALAGAGLLLTSRRLHSRAMLGLVDWELLVLFIGLFVVNHAFQQSGAAAQVLDIASAAGIPLNAPGALFGAAIALSNIVSNVPAVILLLPFVRDIETGTLLALASTFAGNLLIVGSIANIIVVAAAGRFRIRIGWQRHARIGVPLTLMTLAITWIAYRAGHV